MRLIGLLIMFRVIDRVRVRETCLISIISLVFISHCNCVTVTPDQAADHEECDC